MGQIQSHRGIHGVRVGVQRRGLEIGHQGGDGINSKTMSRDRIGTITSPERVHIGGPLNMNRKM